MRFRKTIVLTIAMAALMFSNIAIADTSVSSDDIIIAEPLSENVYNDKSLFVTVNINNPDVYLSLSDEPLELELIKIEDVIPFVDELGSDLKVPLTRITSKSIVSEKTVSLPESDIEKEEVDIINDYFSQMDQMAVLRNEIAVLNEKYDFDSLKESDLVDQSAEVKKAFTTYQAQVKQLKTLSDTFKVTKAEYAKLFEVTLFTDDINVPSFLKDVGKLELGNYKICINDNDDKCLKEFDFRVIKRDETVKPSILSPVTTDSSTNN